MLSERTGVMEKVFLKKRTVFVQDGKSEKVILGKGNRSYEYLMN